MTVRTDDIATGLHAIVSGQGRVTAACVGARYACAAWRPTAHVLSAQLPVEN
jgi:hypothetical protein